ncbi:uncharacterized protein LOC142162183 [Nicotiana tabacum]|uniref:Uncharacterized protein LOC142162183 n=1 Tax=Nicotiana tabacum TaxID=4097 RepID=A0AC58RPE9_TOBAC
MMIAPNIQKVIVNACAKEIMKAIVEDLNGDYFRILVDESKDVSHKEQMALVLQSSFKRRDMLREDQAKKLEELQVLGEVHTGSGLNQELGLQRPERSMAKSLVNDIRSFEFVHMMHLMLKLLAITNNLNMALQRKDQDIVNAMKLVGFAKRQLQGMRESKWESLINDASSFCAKHDIVIPEMELNSHFDAVNSNLLLGMASLSLDNSFANYDKERIMKPATLYPHEFSGSKLEDLSYELDNYILFVKEDNDFFNLKGLGDLSETLVEIDLYKTWRLVFLLVKLSLILPVATAMVEKTFFSMKYIKNDLRSRIGDEFLNDCLVCYIEDEVFETVPNDAIIDRFQSMTTRRVQL